MPNHKCYLQNEVITSCRSCTSANIHPLEYQKKYYLFNLDMSVSVPYAACKNCGLIFQHFYVGDEFLNYYYKFSPMLRRSDPTEYEIDQNKRQSYFVNKHYSLSGKTILEIGAAGGVFLRHLNENYGCVSYFSELSDEAVDIMQGSSSRLKKFPNDGTTVDVVVIRHVLEHVHDLDIFLEGVQKNLKKDGVLFVEVPDWSYFDLDVDPLIFEHLSQFNLRSLFFLFDRLGWGIESIEKSVCPTDPATPNRVVRLLLRAPNVRVNAGAEIIKQFHEYYLPNYNFLNTKINTLLKEMENASIALYPASHLSYTLLMETDLKDYRVVGMFDIDPKKHSNEFEGVSVYDAKALEAYNPDFILITTMGYEDEIKNYLGTLKINSIVKTVKEMMAEE